MQIVKLSGLAASVLVSGALLAPQVVSAQETWHATVGAQSNDKGHQALAFLPNEIWIHAGDRPSPLCSTVCTWPPCRGWEPWP